MGIPVTSEVQFTGTNLVNMSGVNTCDRPAGLLDEDTILSKESLQRFLCQLGFKSVRKDTRKGQDFFLQGY